MLAQLTLQLVLLRLCSAGHRSFDHGLVTSQPELASLSVVNPLRGAADAPPPPLPPPASLLSLSQPLLRTLHRLSSTAPGSRQQQLQRRLRHDVVFWAARGKRPSVHYWDVNAPPSWMTTATMRRFLGLRHKRQREQEARIDNGVGVGADVEEAKARMAAGAAARRAWKSERNKKFWPSRGKKDGDGGGGDFWASRGKKTTGTDFWASRGKRGLYMAYGTDKMSTLRLLETKQDPFWTPRGKKLA